MFLLLLSHSISGEVYASWSSRAHFWSYSQHRLLVVGPVVREQLSPLITSTAVRLLKLFSNREPWSWIQNTFTKIGLLRPKQTNFCFSPARQKQHSQAKLYRGGLRTPPFLVRIYFSSQGLCLRLMCLWITDIEHSDGIFRNFKKSRLFFLIIFEVHTHHRKTGECTWTKKEGKNWSKDNPGHVLKSSWHFCLSIYICVNTSMYM